jgi:hypothetical protein
VYVTKGGQLPQLAQSYRGPHKVLDKGPKYFCLDIGGKDTAVSVDRLKLHTGAAAATPVAPPRRGRPLATRAQSTSPPTPPQRTPSPGLPATTGARPA